MTKIKMKSLNLILTLIAFTISSLVSQAQVQVADVFSDNMVLQRDLEVNVWGKANPKEKIKLTFNGQKKSTKSDKNGDWNIVLKPMKAGGPFNMKICGKGK